MSRHRRTHCVSVCVCEKLLNERKIVGQNSCLPMMDARNSPDGYQTSCMYEPAVLLTLAHSAHVRDKGQTTAEHALRFRYSQFIDARNICQQQYYSRQQFTITLQCSLLLFFRFVSMNSITGVRCVFARRETRRPIDFLHMKVFDVYAHVYREWREFCELRSSIQFSSIALCADIRAHHRTPHLAHTHARTQRQRGRMTKWSVCYFRFASRMMWSCDAQRALSLAHHRTINYFVSGINGSHGHCYSWHVSCHISPTSHPLTPSHTHFTPLHRTSCRIEIGEMRRIKWRLRSWHFPASFDLIFRWKSCDAVHCSAVYW